MAKDNNLNNSKQWSWQSIYRKPFVYLKHPIIKKIIFILVYQFFLNIFSPASRWLRRRV